MKWSWIKGNGIGEIIDAWEALHERARPLDPFMAPRWLAPLGVKRMELLAGWDDDGGRLRVLVPLRRLWGVVMAAGGYVSSEAFELALVDPDTPREAALEGICQALSRRRVPLFIWDGVPGQDPLAAELAVRLRGDSWLCRAREAKESPFAQVAGWPFEQYQRQTLSGPHMARLRSAERRLSRQGKVEMSIIGSAQNGAWREAVAKLGEIEANSWKREFGIFSVGRRQATLGQMEEMARRGALLIGLLHLDGRPIAWDIMLHWGRRVLLYNGAFDENFATFSPGEQLLCEEIRYCFKLEIDTFEFLGKRDRLKDTWSTGRRQRMVQMHYPATVLGRMAERAVAARAFIKKRGIPAS